MTPYSSYFRQAIQSVHGCASTHYCTVPVATPGGKVIDVEVFALVGSGVAEYGYAWREPANGHIATALQLSPVESPRSAVLAWYRRERQAAGGTVDTTRKLHVAELR